MQNFGSVIHGVSPITEHDIYLFKQGSHFRLYEKFGARPMNVEGTWGTFFAVWPMTMTISPS